MNSPLFAVQSTAASVPLVIRRSCGVLILGLLLCGCASINPLAMVPPATGQQLRFIPSNLRVGTVTGGMDPNVTKYALSNDHLKQAITTALRQLDAARSGSPATAAPSALELRATIITQRDVKNTVSAAGIERRRELIAAYELYDLSQARSIWRETYTSEFGSTRSGGNDRLNDVVEGSARENISLLLERLAEHFAK